MDNLGQGCIVADLFHVNDQTSRFNDTARVDERALLLDCRIRFAGNGGLVYRGIATYDTPVNTYLFAEVNCDVITWF